MKIEIEGEKKKTRMWVVWDLSLEIFFNILLI